ncbi:MAG: beta-galactosidase [Alicyclobacillaceae bacterium]|nr:beta-galactosidase [Alicyclobacillaceae bacterium]
MTTSVQIDRHSVLVDGQRLQLVSGAVHYFRIPRDEWESRLDDCWQAGLNTIETIVPWNVHEYHEGKYCFSGNRDLAAFIDLCHSRGFFVIVRPSPYICGEWDNGGLPFWLTQKSDIAYRRANPVFMKYISRWHEVLLPLIVSRQVSSGGPILMVQIENEYGYFGDADEIEYMTFLRDELLHHGVTVPLITCDLPGNGWLVDGATKCANFGSNFREGLRVLADEQPDAFRFVSELWLAWFDHWGGEHHTRSGRNVGNALKEVLAAGGHYNFYMWSGGTNFGYYGGRTTDDEFGAFITASYDYDAPLGETGVITEKFHECRLVNWLAQSYQDLFVDSDETPVTWRVPETDVLLTERLSPSGRTIFVRNDTPNAVTLRLENHDDSVRAKAGTLLSGETRIFLSDVALSPTVKLRLATADAFLNLGKEHLFYGEPGDTYEFHLTVEGSVTVLSGTVPNGQEPARHAVGDVTLYVFAREVARSVRVPKEHASFTVQMDWNQYDQQEALPALSFEQAEVLSALDTRTSDWKSSHPLPLEDFGAYQGYGWYHTSFVSDGTPTRLVLESVHDRATVFLNGRRQGVVGAFAPFALCDIEPTPGVNCLSILLDNLGRYCFTARLGERKGLLGNAYLGGHELALPTWTPSELDDGGLNLRIPWEHGEGILLRVFGLDTTPIEFYLHGHLIYKHRSYNDDDRFFEVNVTKWLRPGDNILEVRPAKSLEHAPSIKAVRYALDQQLTEPWTMAAGVVGESGDVEISTHPFAALSYGPVPVPAENRVAPRFFRSHFKLAPAGPTVRRHPVKLKLTGLGKGSVWLNGHHLGRYWSAGPQTALYIPDSYLSETSNELYIFDEEGRSPDQVHLLYEAHFC